MTRKHFKAIALALHNTKPHPSEPYKQRHQWHIDVHCMAETLAQFNPAFDKNKFYYVCELGNKKYWKDKNENTQMAQS